MLEIHGFRRGTKDISYPTTRSHRNPLGHSLHHSAPRRACISTTPFLLCVWTRRIPYHFLFAMSVSDTRSLNVRSLRSRVWAAFTIPRTRERRNSQTTFYYFI